ncbi:hypothetical protein CCP3SC15_1090005 [Gammaproteobacteria bacterium]
MRSNFQVCERHLSSPKKGLGLLFYRHYGNFLKGKNAIHI